MAIEHVECGTRAADRNARRSHALCRLRAGVSTRRHVRRVAQDEPREPASERAYPRYLRSNATRAPKHRLRVDRQYDRHGAPSIFGCEMLTLNVCVESCLRRVIITSSIERNVKRLASTTGTFVLPAPNPVRSLPHRTPAHCTSLRLLHRAYSHLLSTEDGQALVARRIQARRTEVSSTNSYTF